jgi:hypothetical protein
MSSREHFHRMIQLTDHRPLLEIIVLPKTLSVNITVVKICLTTTAIARTDSGNPCVITGPLPDEMLTLKRLTISDR